MVLEEELATLTLNTDSAAKKPLYLQIAQQIRQLIQIGRLNCDERLPSSRKLALLLNISRTSTLNAYDQLIAEGFLVSRSTSGIFVTALGLNKESLTSNPIHPRKQDKNEDIEILNTFDAGPDCDHFPFNDWSRSLAKSWKKPDQSLLRGRLIGGYQPLRLSVSRYLKAVRGINCHPDQVIVTAGSRDAMALINEVIFQPGDKVALENPCYPPLRHMLKSQSANILNCDIDHQGMCLPESTVKQAWMTPARQYPLGITQSIQRRLEWLDYSKQQKCWIIEDDYDSEFHYRKTPLSTLHSMSTQTQSEDKQRVILMGSFSKLMFRTLRIGYLIVPLRLVDSFLTAQDRLGNMTSILVQPALADFIGHRRFASHLRRMRSIYQQRRDYLHTLIQQNLNPWIESELPDCGMHLLARLKPQYPHSDLWLVAELKKQGIHISALSEHYQSQQVEGLLLGFSGANEASLSDGVNRLARLMRMDK